MFNAIQIDAADKRTLYREVATQLRALLVGERDFIANAANRRA